MVHSNTSQVLADLPVAGRLEGVFIGAEDREVTGVKLALPTTTTVRREEMARPVESVAVTERAKGCPKLSAVTGVPLK
jgi:hypothetical protein